MNGKIEEKKHELIKGKKKSQVNQGKPLKLGLILKTHNQQNSRPKLNEKSSFLISLILKDKIKKYQCKNLSK